MTTMTLAELKEAYLYQKNTKYAALRALQKTEETYYFQSFNPFPQESSEHPYITHKVKPPRGRRIVDGPVDWLAMDTVTCHIPPKAKSSGEETLKSQHQADNNEKWAQALLDNMAKIQPYYLRMASQQNPLRGETYIRVDTDWSYLTNPEGYDGIPFRWIVPDSMMVYAPLDMDSFSRPSLVFEEKVHTFGHVRRLFEQWNPGKTLKLGNDTIKDTQDVFLVEWWTPEMRGYFAGQGGVTESSWYAVPIDGEDMLPNLAKVTPYIRGFSPLGIWPYDGDITKLIIGFLRPMGHVIMQDARDRSKIDTITNYWAAPITSWVKDDASLKLDDADLTIAPGHIYEQIKGRKELKIEPAPPIPSSLLQQIELNERLLEEYDPMLLRGRGLPGETAVGQSQRVGLGLQKWEPLKTCLRQMIANTLSTTFKIVEEMGIPVKIAERSLSKADINGYYQMEVTIKPGNPEERTRQMLLGKDMAEFYSDEELAEKFFGEENATEHVRKNRISKMIKLQLLTAGSPLWNQVWGEALRELGMEREAEKFEAEARRKLAEMAQLGQEASGQEESAGFGGPVLGAHPTRGAPGVANVPPTAEPQSQEELKAAQEALANLGGA